jgi:hypothetical protein
MHVGEIPPPHAAIAHSARAAWPAVGSSTGSPCVSQGSPDGRPRLPGTRRAASCTTRDDPGTHPSPGLPRRTAAAGGASRAERGHAAADTQACTARRSGRRPHCGGFRRHGGCGPAPVHRLPHTRGDVCSRRGRAALYRFRVGTRRRSRGHRSAARARCANRCPVSSPTPRLGPIRSVRQITSTRAHDRVQRRTAPKSNH